MDRAAQILELAQEAGFDLAGLATLRPPRDAERFGSWIAAGHHADMAWLERNLERIQDPRRVRPEARSLLVVGVGHARPDTQLVTHGGPGAPAGRMARYAAGRDYHNVLTRRLRKLARRLEAAGLAGRSRSIVDAGPLLERSHAEEAGLGFASKAANLLHPRHGPWFFLGELLLDAELEIPAPTPPAGSCGTCTACIDSCPTAAILEPGVVDARLCLSYHTIENRGSVPHALRDRIGPWAFGCDVCSEVCPWGDGAPDASAGFGTHPFVAERSLVDWLRLPEPELRAELVGSPLQRPGRDGLARNAALVLGNRPSEEGRTALTEALREDAAPVVRASAYWALAHAHADDPGTRGELDRALGREPDGPARHDMQRTRDGARAAFEKTNAKDARRES